MKKTLKEANKVRITEQNFKHTIKTRNINYFQDFILKVIEKVYDQFDNFCSNWACCRLLSDLNETAYIDIYEMNSRDLVITFEKIRHAMHTTNSFVNALFSNNLFSQEFLDSLSE